LSLVEIPKKCKILTFDNVFETCMKHYKMIVIAVYKRHYLLKDPVQDPEFAEENQEMKKQKEEQ
jgi:hypothetical protein